MSTYNLGIDHDSDEVAALKSKLSVKENEIAMLKDHLVQSSTKSQDLNTTLKETNYKLRQEADRRTKLEEDFRQCSESYHNLKTAKENAELTLDSLTDRLKLSEKTSRELQSIIDLMSSNSDGQKQKIQQAQSHLERENSKLTTRLRELEFECRQLRDSTAAPKDSVSTTVDPRMIWLEQENERLRQLSLEHEDELRTFTNKLTNLQSTLAQVENEKVATDRRMQAQINALQEKLEESGEELDYLRQQVGEASAAEREQQLMDRIDEDQAKIEQLAKLVDGSRKTEETLRRIEVTLKMETTKAIKAEARNEHLIREKEEALDALEKHRMSLLEHERRIDQLQARESDFVEQLNALRSPTEQSDRTNLLATIPHEDLMYRASTPAKHQIPSNFEDGLMEKDDDLTYLVHSTPIPSSKPSNQSSSQHEVERLLVAIERIRGERDNLRRQLEFSQMEHKFAVQEYETRLAATVSDDNPVGGNESSDGQLKEQITFVCDHTLSKAPETQLYHSQAKPSALALIASSIVINRLQTRLDLVHGHLDQVVKAKECQLIEMNNRVVELEGQLAQKHMDFGNIAHERNELLSQVEIIRKLHMTSQETSVEKARQTEEQLAQVQLQVSNLNNVISDLENERDALSLETQHLQADLTDVQQELVETQARYSSLQAQQLSSMSSNVATRALRQQIEDLEARLLRRNEQIGIHQHDIRRMETNMRLQEDRIAEMTVELETLSSQKEAMVEDCAEAREARDLALQKVEAMEVEVEAAEEKVLTLENSRDMEVTGLVSVVMDGATRTRDIVLRIKHMLHSQFEDQKRLMERLRRAEETKVTNFDCMDTDTVESAAPEATNSNSMTSCHDREAVVALVVSQMACGNYAHALETMVSLKDSLEGTIKLQQEIIISGTNQISLLQCQLEETFGSSDGGQSHLEMETQIAVLEDRIQTLLQTAKEVESRHDAQVADLVRKNDEILQAGHGVTWGQDFQKQVDALRASHQEEIQMLQSQLDVSSAELRKTQEERSGSNERLRCLQNELVGAKEDIRSRVSEVERTKTALEDEISAIQKSHTEEFERVKGEMHNALQALEERTRAHGNLQQQHEVKVTELLQIKEDLHSRLTAAETAHGELQQQLEKEIDGWDQERQRYQDELRCAVDRSHKTEAELHREVLGLQFDLEHSHAALEAMTEGKNGLEVEMTNFVAEIQRSISLRQYLEKQVKEGESEISSLSDQLVRFRKEYAVMEKNWSASEVQSSLQESKHKEAMSAMKRELEAVKGKPNLENELFDLKERYDEMEELLKTKCAEVEATDDKYLEVLQERRKLNTRLENLSRKVVSLEKKLAEASSTSTPAERPADPVVPSRPLAPRSSTSLVTQTSSSKPPSSNSSQSRARTKTPEPKAERKASTSRVSRPSTSTEESQQSAGRPASAEATEAPVSTGKKRRAPDDFDACETVPPQVFTSESIPVKKQENTTPRARRVATTVRTGFTPVRNKQTPTESIRRVSTAVVPTNTTISDVTNGPTPRSVSQSTIPDAQKPTVAGKRSWLRNVRAAR